MELFHCLNHIQWYPTDCRPTAEAHPKQQLFVNALFNSIFCSCVFNTYLNVLTFLLHSLMLLLNFPISVEEDNKTLFIRIAHGTQPIPPPLVHLPALM
jgi:hypothetical protein